MATIVVGLDGAHWELLDPWIERGDLPNLQRIKKEGVWGDLQSCLPPVTSPNWKCYSTGKNPGKLGVYWWEIVDAANGEITSPQSTDFPKGEIWEYLARGGIRSGVVNVPLTYPPRSECDVLVTGGPDSDDTGYTTPEWVAEALEERFDYRVHPEKRIRSGEAVDQATIESHMDAIESRFDVAEWLLETEELEFLHVTTFYVNVLHHFFWNDEPTHRAWQRIDERLGSLMDDGHDILLMSDHGATSIDWQVNLNKWLEEEGYLELNEPASGVLHRAGITRERIVSILSHLPYRDGLVDLVPASIKNSIPSADGTLPNSTKGDNIDWSSSVAVASGQGPVYVLEDDPTRQAELTAELAGKLEDLTDPDDEPVFGTVHRGSDIYHGPYTDVAPTLVAEQRPGYHVPGSLGGDGVFQRPDRWRAENKRTGLIAAWGTDIASTGRLDREDPEISILDLGPTILHWFDVGVPTDFDGDVRKAVFSESSDVYDRPVEDISPVESVPETGATRSRSVDQKLEDLGYL